MRIVTHKTTEARQRGMTLVLLGVLGLGFASCQSPHNPTARSEAPPPRRAETNIDPGWPHADRPFVRVSYPAVHAGIPKLEGAELVNDDEICMQCHEAYVKSFHDNVHRVISCEACHGPASRHVETRGKEPGLIFSFKKGTNPVVRAEVCLKCHEQDQCQPGAQWRTSKHAQCGVTCVDCHRGHYNVPPVTPAVTEPKEALAVPAMRATLVSYNAAEDAKKNLPSLRGTSHHLGAMAPDLCLKCHCDMRDLLRIAGPHQIGGPNGFNCTTCHDPHGQIREYTRKDLCLTCHKGAPPWPGTPRPTSAMAWPAPTATTRTRTPMCGRS